MPRRRRVHGRRALQLQVADLNVGILYVFAMAGTGIVGAAIAGWASDNKFSLLGGLRAASQMVSYEVTMGLTLVGAIMIYGTLRLDDMVALAGARTRGASSSSRSRSSCSSRRAIAEIKRIPFDLPEGESEIVAGYFTEYSGMKFGMFFFARVHRGRHVAARSWSRIFLGGWHLPFLHRDGLHVAFGETVLFDAGAAARRGDRASASLGVRRSRSLVLCWLQLIIRWTLAALPLRPAHEARLARAPAASLANILVTGVVVLAIVSAAAPAVERRCSVARPT